MCILSSKVCSFCGQESLKMYKVGVVPIVGQIAIISGTYRIRLKLHNDNTAVKSIVNSLVLFSLSTCSTSRPAHVIGSFPGFSSVFLTFSQVPSKKNFLV